MPTATATSAPGLGSRAILAVLGGLVLLLLAGCGGDEDGATASAPPPPEDCLASWNGETASLTFGSHVYDVHTARQAQVAVLDASPGAINVKGKQTCAVIFSVEPNDYEYGDVGLVITKFGWASMTELARGEASRLDEIQSEASSAPNVNVFPDGTIEEI